MWKDVINNCVYLRAVKSKNRDAYLIPMTDRDGQLNDIGVMIERQRKLRAITTKTGATSTILCDRVFHVNGARIYEFKKSWATACHKAGLEGKKFHDFRRTAARNMIDAGVPESVAMKITGHKTAAMFKRYSIVSKKNLMDAITAVVHHNHRAEQQVIAIGD